MKAISQPKPGCGIRQFHRYDSERSSEIEGENECKGFQQMEFFWYLEEGEQEQRTKKQTRGKEG
jgi:hypothetical protein